MSFTIRMFSRICLNVTIVEVSMLGLRRPMGCFERKCLARLRQTLKSQLLSENMKYAEYPEKVEYTIPNEVFLFEILCVNRYNYTAIHLLTCSIEQNEY